MGERGFKSGDDERGWAMDGCVMGVGTTALRCGRKGTGGVHSSLFHHLEEERGPEVPIIHHPQSSITASKERGPSDWHTYSRE